MVTGSSKISNLVKTYDRLIEHAEMEDDRMLPTFFMGCLYAATTIYDIILMDEIEEEIEEEENAKTKRFD